MLVNPLHYLHGYELANLTLLSGVLASIGVQRASGINPGGIVAIAFLVLAASSSMWWALVMPLVAIAIAWAYKRYFSHVFLGRQPLFYMTTMSIIVMTILGVIMSHYHLVHIDHYSFPLGIITPAILAATIRKQGVVQTYAHSILAIALTLEAVGLIYFIGQSLGHDFYVLDAVIASRESLVLNGAAGLSLVSVAIGYYLYRWKSVKSAGFVMLPFLATLCVVSPVNFLLICAIAVITYSVAAIMRRYSLIIGIGRYSFVAILAITLAWTAEYVLLRTTDTFSPFMGTSVFAALAITVLVNEHTIYGLRRTLPLFASSLLLMIGLEFGGLFLLQKASHDGLHLQAYTIVQPEQSVQANDIQQQ